MRNSFILRRSYYEYVKTLPLSMFRGAVEAIMEYGLNDIKTDFLLPSFIYESIDRDNKNLGRRTAEYNAWRKSVYERDDYTCVMCGHRGGILNAHHIKPYALYPEYRYELDNGITLCVDCHRGVHRAK